MTQIFPLYGYVYIVGMHGPPQTLEDQDGIIKFLKANLYAEKLTITDNHDELWYESVDGVDLFSRLNELGIDLPAIFQWVRYDQYRDDSESEEERQPWEDLYDSIGLSPGEIAMRKRVKKEAIAARTLADVIELVKGTYFDVILSLPGEQEAWGYFDPNDCSVSIYPGENESGLAAEDQIVRMLPATTRVMHKSSGEDIHHFELVDLPDITSPE